MFIKAGHYVSVKDNKPITGLIHSYYTKHSEFGGLIGEEDKGNLRMIKQVVDGLVQGKQIAYYETGQIKSEFNFRDFQRHGLQKNSIKTVN